MTTAIPRLAGQPKATAYAELERLVRATLVDITDSIAAMATISAIVHHAFEHLWTGFYRRTAADTLVIGPYQGTVGCLVIGMGRGVCGTAAAERRTIVVPDVAAFPGHITCDARSRSEIVVPVFDRRSRLIAVFDIDSERPAAFDDDDARGLESLLRWFADPERAALSDAERAAAEYHITR